MESELSRAATKWEQKRKQKATQDLKERNRLKEQKLRIAEASDITAKALEEARKSRRKALPPQHAVTYQQNNNNDPKTLQDSDCVYRQKLTVHFIDATTNCSEFDNSDRILLPQSVLAKLSDASLSTVVEFPLQFHIFCFATTQYTHCGVLEFSADEGCCILPKTVAHSLGLKSYREASIQINPTFVDVRKANDFPRDVSEVVITSVKLQKGTYAKLRPLCSSIYNIPNFKNAIEAELQARHATLTIGECLSVANTPILVLQLEPDDGVSVIDTELSVDVEPLSLDAASNEFTLPYDGAAHMSTNITLGDTVHSTVNADETHGYHISFDSSIVPYLEDKTYEIRISLDTSPEDGCHLFVSFPPMKGASHYSHYLSDMSPGYRVISVSLTDIGLIRQQTQSSTCGSRNTQTSRGGYDVIDVKWPNSVFIGVEGFSQTCQYTLATSVNEWREKIEHTADEATSLKHCNAITISDNRKTCDNCMKVIPSATYELHLLHCMRHFQKCETCNSLLRRSEIDEHCHCEICHAGMRISEKYKHIKFYHKVTACECGKVFDLSELISHRKTDCSMRLIFCKFCGTYVLAGDVSGLTWIDRHLGITPHESYCGSRTEPCSVCGKLVVMKFMEMHNEAEHSTLVLPLDDAHKSNKTTTNQLDDINTTTTHQ